MATSFDGYLVSKAQELDIEVRELKEIAARLESLGYQLVGRTSSEDVSGLMMASAVTHKIAKSIETSGDSETGEHGDCTDTVHSLFPSS
ncbi:hypothetical protein [Pseudooceanicola sp. 200-1SW]|uniref:hypothetical protein n=1 Tax=Pseudooceanicola sp. 200-1SW TaxID=3425949 RepID=UPI003D7FBB3C